MKTNLTKRLLSLLLGAVMLISLFSTAATAWAESTYVKDIVLTVDEDLLPKAGEPIKRAGNLFSVPVGRPYTINKDYSGYFWTDDHVKPKKYDGQQDEWYTVHVDPCKSDGTGYNEAGVVFEAGRTYHITMYLYISPDVHGSIWFNNDQINSIRISNLSPSAYEVVRYRTINSYDRLQIEFAFKADGSIEHNDISQVTFYEKYKESGEAKDRIPLKQGGWDAPQIVAAYGNFSCNYQYYHPDNEGVWIDTRTGKTTSQSWNSNVAYIKRFVLTAYDGYKFSPDVTTRFLYYDLQPSKLELSKDRKILTVEFTFVAESYDYVSEIRIKNSASVENFIPRSGDAYSSGLPRSYLTVDNQDVQYSERGSYQATAMSRWHDEKDNPATQVRAGYVYHFSLTLDTDDPARWRFSNDLDIEIQNIPDEYLYVETEFDSPYSASRVKITWYAIAGSQDQAYGQTAETPVLCSTYEGLKWCLEQPRIKYVRFAKADNSYESNQTLPLVQGKDTRIDAITVAGEKHLTLTNSVCFTTVPVDSSSYCDYDSFIRVPQDASLTVNEDENSPNASLTYVGSLLSGDNAVIRNEGSLTVNGGRLIGSTQLEDAHAYGVINYKGNLTINGGTIECTNAGADPIAAVAVFHGLSSFTGSTAINGGFFKTNDTLGGSNWNYGLQILGGSDLGATADTKAVVIDGGVYYGRGIQMPNTSMAFSRFCKYDTHRLYFGTMPYDDISQCRQAKFDDNLEGPVTVVRLLDRVDVTVGLPATNVTFDEKPTIKQAGVECISFKWYEDGVEIEVPSANTANKGSTYRLEMILRGVADEGVNLMNYNLVTATLNGKSVTPAYAGYNRNAVKLTYEFPNVANYLCDVRVYANYYAEHQAVRNSLTTGDSTAYNAGNVKWYCDGALMSTGTAFELGHEYEVEFDLLGRNGNKFMFLDGEPVNLFVMLNDEYYCTISQSTVNANYVHARYTLPEVADTVIEEIPVVMQLPGAGEYPTYDWAVGDYRLTPDMTGGGGYDMANDGNTAWRRYYTKNGVNWYDVTESRVVYEDEVLLPGHTYQVTFNNVKIVDTELYTYYGSDKYVSESYVTATLNGAHAEAEKNTVNAMWNHGVVYTFTCDPGVISGVEATVAEPFAGKTPSQTAVATSDDRYTVSVAWYKDDGYTLMAQDAAFVGGNVYDAEVTFTLKEAGSRFSGTAAIINGELATRVISLTDNEMIVRVSFVSDDNTSSIIGDLDGDGEVTDADAIYLLMYTFFPEEYPVDQSVDFDGDGEATDADAIYLLMYTFFPEEYPIV